MKTFNNLYTKLCSRENLEKAFKMARKGKTKKSYVINFEKNLDEELNKLQEELIDETYTPKKLQRFIVRDPKTRVIHASSFRDRIVYHALINVIGPIFEKRFIYDSYASRINKGTHKALIRFDVFKRKTSHNGKLIKNARNANEVCGYILKCDIRHYFETIDHSILLSMLERKISDKKVIFLIKKILMNYDSKVPGKGMPLGNYTSQFFANVYLNELDYFIKHALKVKCYMRYVDDFIIFHYEKRTLFFYLENIKRFLGKLKIELHQEKTKIIPLRNGVPFVGYRIFYMHKLLRKRNLKLFVSRIRQRKEQFQQGKMPKEEFMQSIKGWLGYAQWANTYGQRKKILKEITS